MAVEMPLQAPPVRRLKPAVEWQTRSILIAALDDLPDVLVVLARVGLRRAAPAAIQEDACRRHAPQIHKPSARVSFGLPDPLSFQVRSHAMVARRSGTNTRQGKRQGQAAKQPDPPSWECNADITKIKAQEGKGEPDARLCVLDTVDGQAQPGQYGCYHCRLGRGSARPSGGQAFLRPAAFA